MGSDNPSKGSAKPRARVSAKAGAAKPASAKYAQEWLRAALNALPEGIVFLDEDGRYILWNDRYSDIYKKSADLFKPGVRLAETLRIGVARGDYPEAVGREEQWIAERLAKLATPQGPHEQLLADGRWILIEETKMPDGCTIGLRVDVTAIKQREEGFRLLFEDNPIPMFLLDEDGRGVWHNDDCAQGNNRPRLENVVVPRAGNYYIAISPADVDPVSAGGPIFNDLPARYPDTSCTSTTPIISSNAAVHCRVRSWMYPMQMGVTAATRYPTACAMPDMATLCAADSTRRLKRVIDSTSAPPDPSPITIIHGSACAASRYSPTYPARIRPLSTTAIIRWSRMRWMNTGVIITEASTKIW